MGRKITISVSHKRLVIQKILAHFILKFLKNAVKKEEIHFTTKKPVSLNGFFQNVACVITLISQFGGVLYHIINFFGSLNKHPDLTLWYTV